MIHSPWMRYQLELLACLFGFLMRCMGLAKRAIFFQFQFMGNCFLILRCCVVPLFAVLASQRNLISHNSLYRVTAAGLIKARLHIRQKTYSKI